jgi:hypothetical protein
MTKDEIIQELIAVGFRKEEGTRGSYIKGVYRSSSPVAVVAELGEKGIVSIGNPKTGTTSGVLYTMDALQRELNKFAA